MSGLEVIGAIASASQLFQYTVTLVNNLRTLYRNVERAGERCGLYREQIGQLLEIAGLIKSLGNLLCSETVTAHVRGLVKTTETIDEALRPGSIGDISKWKKCLKAVQWGKMEGIILKAFSDLEREKSCLVLSLLANYGGLLTRIDRNIEDGLPKLQEQVGRIERALSDCSTLVGEGEKITNTSAFLDNYDCPRQHDFGMRRQKEENVGLVFRGVQALRAQSQGQIHDDATQPSTTDGCSDSTSGSLLAVERRDSAHSDGGYETFANSTLADDPPAATRSWSGNMASEGAMQINGNVGKKNAVDSAMVNCCWNRNEASGQSKQVNGEILDAKFAAIFFCQAEPSG